MSVWSGCFPCVRLTLNHKEDEMLFCVPIWLADCSQILAVIILETNFLLLFAKVLRGKEASVTYWKLSSELIFRISPATTRIKVMSCAWDLGNSQKPRRIPCRQEQSSARGLSMRQTLLLCCAQPAPWLGDFLVPEGDTPVPGSFHRAQGSCRSQDHRGCHVSPCQLLQSVPELHPDEAVWFHPSGTQWQGGKVKPWPWDYTAKLYKHA